LPQKGGIITYYVNFVNTIKENNAHLDVSFIVPGNNRSEYFIGIPFKNGIPILVATFFKLLRLSPDVIHCADHRYMILGAAIYKCLRPHVKLIICLHTDVARSFRTDDSQVFKKRISFKDTILKWSMETGDLIFYVSKYLESLMQCSLNIRKSSSIIPTGVSIMPPSLLQIEEFKSRYNLSRAYPIISTIGVFEWEWKVAGVELLLEAFNNLQHDTGRLIIVGDGKYRKRIESKIAELSLEDRVIITGYLDDPCVALAVSNIYCHLALREALGISVLESMVMGIPIVALKKGGIPEIIKNQVTGILTDPNAKDILFAIETLLSDTNLRNKIVENAKKVAANEHNWQAIVKWYSELISYLVHTK
jgi:glycosyltransferase involved in cell wall biosynthesis